jgi:hypothetical protein
MDRRRAGVTPTGQSEPKNGDSASPSRPQSLPPVGRIGPRALSIGASMWQAQRIAPRPISTAMTSRCFEWVARLMQKGGFGRKS